MSLGRSKILKSYYKERAGVENSKGVDMGDGPRFYPDSLQEYGLLKNPFVDPKLYRKTKYDWEQRNPDRTFGFVGVKKKGGGSGK